MADKRSLGIYKFAVYNKLLRKISSLRMRYGGMLNSRNQQYSTMDVYRCGWGSCRCRIYIFGIGKSSVGFFSADGFRVVGYMFIYV